MRDIRVNIFLWLYINPNAIFLAWEFLQPYQTQRCKPLSVESLFPSNKTLDCLAFPISVIKLHIIFPRGVKVWSVSVTVIEWSGPFFHNNREYNIEIDRKTTCFIIWFCTRSFQEVLKYSHLIVKTTTLTLMNFSCGHPILTYVQQKSFNHNNTRKMFPIFQPMFSDDFFFLGYSHYCWSCFNIYALYK